MSALTHPAESLPCPYCSAQCGQRCVHHTTAGDVPASAGWVHPERDRAWRPVAGELRRAAERLHRDRCPTCGDSRGERFSALIGAPGYGHAGACEHCGANLWRAGAGQPWTDVRSMDGPPELTEADVR